MSPTDPNAPGIGEWIMIDPLVARTYFSHEGPHVVVATDRSRVPWRVELLDEQGERTGRMFWLFAADVRRPTLLEKEAAARRRDPLAGARRRRDENL